MITRQTLTIKLGGLGRGLLGNPRATPHHDGPRVVSSSILRPQAGVPDPTREFNAPWRRVFLPRLRSCGLLVLLLGLVGCVYLRLLEVKNQLRDFDGYFRVEVTDQFVLRFRHPVLFSDDFVYLTQLEPTRTEQHPLGARWFVDFHKLDSRGQIESPRKTLTFTMTFDTASKLTSFAFSPLFLAMAPPEFLEASIRSMGKGKVDTDRRQLRVDPQDLPKIRAKLPTRRVITDIFGKPAAQMNMEEGLFYLYHFVVDAHPVEDKSPGKGIAEVKLLFDPSTEELTRMAGKFVGLKLKINYRNLQPRT